MYYNAKNTQPRRFTDQITGLWTRVDRRVDRIAKRIIADNICRKPFLFAVVSHPSASNVQSLIVGDLHETVAVFIVLIFRYQVTR